MTRIAIAALTAALVAAVAASTGAAAGAASTAAAAPPTLVGTVGPGFTITLTKSGKKVKVLKAGKYRIVVNDKASIHNFALSGPKGFAKTLTGISFVGTKSVVMSLKKGSYRFFCQPHESFMFGNFVVK